jgi:uracil permease
VLTSVVLTAGVSGAAVKLGAVELKGMALGTTVAIALSLLFWAFDRLGISNDAGA